MQREATVSFRSVLNGSLDVTTRNHWRDKYQGTSQMDFPLSQRQGYFSLAQTPSGAAEPWYKQRQTHAAYTERQPLDKGNARGGCVQNP